MVEELSDGFIGFSKMSLQSAGRSMRSHVDLKIFDQVLTNWFFISSGSDDLTPNSSMYISLNLGGGWLPHRRLKNSLGELLKRVICAFMLLIICSYFKVDFIFILVVLAKR